jgi:hypothetical protein
LRKDLEDDWREKKLPFSQSHSAVLMMCRDLLEATQDYAGEELALYDQALASQGAPTLSAMRVRHWKLVPKILKRGRIKNDDEYYLVRSVLDSSTLASEDHAALMSLLHRYGVDKK